MIPTALVVCPHRKGKKHQPTFMSGHCETGFHGSCRGAYTHPCGCTVPCRCTAPGHPEDRPHAYQEDPVPLPDPFTVPDPKAAEHPEAVVTPQPDAAPTTHWDTTAPTPAARPWVDGTGAGAAPLEVMVRAFAMAAGDLHLSDDGPDDYDETALWAMLGILRAAVRRAGLLDAVLVKHLYDTTKKGQRLVEGIGQVRVYRRDSKVRWDERGTAMAVIDQHMADLGGEQPDPYVVADWLLEAGAVDYYRVTALRALGIDPEDYRHREKGTIAVDVPVPD